MSFIVNVLLEERLEVLQVPVVKPISLKKLLTANAPRIPLLGSSNVPTTDDSLEQFLHHVGTLFGKDPTKWEKVGETKTEVTEEEGKRIIKRTGMFTGTELHLWYSPQYFDPRLPARPDQPHLEFAVQKREIRTNEEWQQLTADQPWSPSRRRQLLLNFLQAKLEAEDEQLQLEGARGMWEISINKPHHAELELVHLRPLIEHLQSTNIEVARTCAAAIWGFAVNERSRGLLLQLNVVKLLLQLAQQSLNLACVADPDHQETYLAGGKCSQTQRNQLQASVLGSLSVMLVDAACRRPLVAMEPGCDVLFRLSSNLEGYADKVWAAARKEAAAKAITSLIQRDHEARTQLIATGGITKILDLLDSKGPGSSRVQYCMASMLATLVLDEGAMDIIKQRHEGHLMFEATLRLLSHVMNALKFALAIGGDQILSEGMTEADVKAALQQRHRDDSHGQDSDGQPNMQLAANRLSQHDAVSSLNGGAPALARRLSTDAQQVAALLAEASIASKLSSSDIAKAQVSQQQSYAEEDEDVPEPLDVKTAVSLAEACAQAMWGSAHYSLEEPLHITQDHVIALGKLGLDCILISELDLGRVCHCLSATLASLASHEKTASFIMDAPGDSVAKAMLALLEVEDEPGLSNAGHIRAAASTCLAFLACHPIGAKGDSCLFGPFRERLLGIGAFGALLKAALACSVDDPCDAIIQQTAAVGIMYMSTMAGAVDSAELAMYAALMTSNTNIQMVEYLMAGMWILLKHPSNRQVLGGAFQVNPAASMLTKNMINKLNDTIDVADANETAEMLTKMRQNGLSTRKLGPTFSTKQAGLPGLSADGGAASAAQEDIMASTPSLALEETLADWKQDAGHVTGCPDTVKVGSGVSYNGQQRAPSATTSSSNHTSSRPITRAESPSGGLLSESSFGALAAEADTMEDKLQLVQSKRKSVLFNNIASGDFADRLHPSSTPEQGPTPLSRQEVSDALKEGPDSTRTIEHMRSMDKSLNRTLTNLDQQLGSELEDNWGLDVLVRVGETWLPKLAESSVVPRGQSLQGSVQQMPTDREAEARADVPLLKLFEFLTASLCLYVIEEEPTSPLHQTANVYSSCKAPGAPVRSGPGWWTVAAPMMQADPELSPLLHRTVHILMTVLRLRMPAAWKILQLSVVMLWNAAVQSANVEKYQVAEGVCSLLLDIINSRLWPPTLRDLASGHLQFLIETHDNLLKTGAEWQQRRGEQQNQQQQLSKQTQSARAQVSGTGSTSSGNSNSRSPGKPSLTPLNANRPSGSQCDVVQPANPLPFDLQAMLNPTAAVAAAAGGRFKLKQRQPPDPLEEAVSAAGVHVGLVPVMSCFVSLMRTGHPLLELSGARGIARLCFAGAMGAPAMSQLLAEAKATAAVVGALGALVDLLRVTATKFMVLEDGGRLPPLPLLTHLVDKEYGIYERDVNNWEGVLELLTVLLAAMLNLSTLRANQPKLARKGLMVLLKANTSLYQVISCRDAPSEVEMKLLDLLAAIIQNLSSHPDNRTHMYRAELAGTAALDRVLEGPGSPEPIDTSAALLATRLTGHISAAAAASAAASCSPGRAVSPAAALQPERIVSPSQGGAGIIVQATAAVDTVVSAAAVLRPKVVFPPISRGGGDLIGNTETFRASSPSSPTAAGSGWPESPTAGQAELGAVAVGLSKPPAIIPPRTAGLRSSQGPRSLRSRGAATSVAGMPGSPALAPDNREQFLIWMDSTFIDVNEGSQGMSAAEGPNKERRTYRRQLWDEQGDWLQQEPESAQALHRLLCRPLKHLWQDSPEARARAGNARWSPAVSEYRQANPKYPLQHAAEGMVTTAPPAEAGDLLEATAQLATLGRCETGAMSLERPSTRERMRGRVPMTVLEPSAQLFAAHVVAAPGGGGNQEQQPAEPSTSRSGSDTWQQQSTQNSSAGQQQQQQQQLDITVGTLVAPASRLALKVVLSPQRPRTVISFENRVFTSDGPGSRPVLTMWPHTDGSKVSKGLFQEYALPNGRQCFMYYNSGNVMDEAEVPPVWPPARPTTVPLALQQSMPLAQVLSIMSKPPGSAPPFVPWKPVPRLVPLPGSHSLTVSRPEQLDSAAYGRLRPDNLQLSITAQAIMKSQSTVTEESVAVQLTEAREPWTLPSSIFKPRVKESDARAFYDGGATLDKMFERDWARACGKEKFTSMLARENKGNAAGKSDKQAMQDVHDMLKRNFQAFYSIFVYYACGGNDPYHMPLNSYSSLLDDAGIPDPDSLSCKRSDCDTIFIVCNFQPDKNSPDVAVNDEHAMMRFEFMEAVVRLALAKYGKGQSTADLGIAVELLFERNLLPRLPPMAMLVSNDFRTERLYTEEVDMLLKQHQALLKVLYSRYRLKPSAGGLRPKVLKLDGWLALMADAKLVDSQFTLADANLSFLWARMFVIDEIKDYSRYTTLTFIDFLEAIGRVADAKSLPTASDLDAAGYSSILEWALEKERMEGGNNGAAVAPGAAAAAATLNAGESEAIVTAPGNMSSNLPEIFRPRLSARFGAPKPRLLYAKLEILLDLIFRRLYWDPAEPDSVFSYEGLLRMVKKIDKDLGP